ncbi:hypothetical protein [Pseudonocardia acidicola]|uniref:Uncharacterized protein n=1 Tax=Pseudonocardia acidicola TaxID=2724939 RepID=A0ABX1S6X5_9PSEU|nr:hypothetical protein [Pseudonocardia acidicola]NMH97296.1 hypothetical protein [Pseudonocardia acidicola]
MQREDGEDLCHGEGDVLPFEAGVLLVDRVVAQPSAGLVDQSLAGAQGFEAAALVLVHGGLSR